MIAKIDVREIVATHFASLIDGKGNQQWGDWLLFLGIPVACALMMIVKKGEWVLNSDSLSTFVNLGSIFTALFISVLMLVFDQMQKTDDKLKALAAEENSDFVYRDNLFARLMLMKEVIANIAYSVVVSILLVFTALGCQFLGSAHILTQYFFAPASIFLIANLLLTALMIIKRTYILVSTA